MNLDDLMGGDHSWGLSLRGAASDGVGPVVAFGDVAPDLTVTLAPGEAVPKGTPEPPVEVVESAATFQVIPHRFARENLQGVWHPRGANWVVWRDDLRAVWVTHAASGAESWVHARFVLRHFAVTRLLERDGHGRAHAVAASITGAPGSAVLVAGRSGSGKTRLMNRLLVDGHLGSCIEDDCAVIGPEWSLIAVLPAQREFVRPRRAVVRAVVWLDSRVDQPREASAVEGGGIFNAFPASWPAAWLPGPGVPTELPDLGEIPCLRIPERSDHDEDMLGLVRTFIEDIRPAR